MTYVNRVSEETKSILDGSVFSPDGPDPKEGEPFSGPLPEWVTLLGPNWLQATYIWEDGSNGYLLSDGEKSIHFTNKNDIVLSAGKPSQGGCGGKFVTNTQEQIHSATAIAIEVSGRENETTETQNSDGNVDKQEAPAYSLKVYGDIQIECVGGNVAIKGDSITLNANNTLNLVSGKDINLQAGKDGGNIQMTAANVKMDAAFLKKKASNGEYSDGTAEVQTDQYLPGSSTTINSVGDYIVILNGKYDYTTTGNYSLNVQGTFKQDITLDYALSVKQNYGVEVLGKSKFQSKGVASIKGQDPNLPNYEIEVGPGKGAAELPTFSVNSQGSIAMAATTGGFKATTGAKGKAISELSFDEKQGTFRVGDQLGYLALSPKDVELGYTKTSKINIAPAKISIEAPGIYLN